MRHPLKSKQVFSNYNEKTEGNFEQFKYCPHCGIKLRPMEIGDRKRQTCVNCDFIHYINPLPGVCVLIEDEGRVLIGKRGEGYGKGKWGLPQGYIEFNEDFLSAAIREVKEETGLVIQIRNIINVVSNMLSPRLHTLVIVLLAGVVSGELSAGDDLEIVEWIPLSGPLPDMAFEADEYIIERYQKTKSEKGLNVDLDFAR